MTITRRIALVAAAAVAVTVFVASVAAFFGARSQILGQIDESLVERVELYSQISSFDIPRNGNTSARDPLAGLAALLPRQVRADFDTTYIQIATPRGEINFSANELILPTPESSTLTVGEVDLRSVWVDGVHVRIAALAETQPARIVQVGRPLAEADETLAGLAILLLVGSALGILFAAGLGYVVARSAIKPIGVLEHEITDIASSKTLGGRVEVTGTDEVAQLGLAFNELLDELESAKAQQARLVRDAGHELRTPLTALRTNLEILQRHEVPQEDRARMLESAHAEVEELTELVAEVVDLATDRYDEEPVSTVSLAEIVGAVADRTQRRNGREVEITARQVNRSVSRSPTARSPSRTQVQVSMATTSTMSSSGSIARRTLGPHPARVLGCRSSSRSSRITVDRSLHETGPIGAVRSSASHSSPPGTLIRIHPLLRRPTDRFHIGVADCVL